MTWFEQPARRVEIDRQLDHLARNEGSRVAVRVAVSGVEHAFGDQRRAAIGSDVAEPRGEADDLRRPEV